MHFNSIYRYSIALTLLCISLLGIARDTRGDAIDVASYTLNINLTDFTGKIMQANAVIGIKARQNGVDHIQLDLLKLTVDSVKADGVNASYSYNDSVIDLYLFNTLNTGDSTTLQVYYHGHPLQLSGDFGGFYWTSTYAFNIGVSFLADPHTYGRVWFPCLDNFEVRSNYEFYVTTKNAHKAFCNGILLDTATSGANKIWHWKLAEKIPSYLASVTVSDYQTITDTVQGINGTIPIQLAARATDTAALNSLFVHLHDAFHIEESLWGPYEWERVGYCIVPFSAGAMEHATNISFMQYYLNAYASDCETTMAHELSHHWFGNLVTCDSASEMWLNEGWASYNEHTFVEGVYGKQAYDDYTRNNHEYVVHMAHVNDEAYLPVSGVPADKTYGTTVYSKGADVIHTLRWYMGDSLFFHCMRNFLTDNKWHNIGTAQLRNYLSQCSGINLNDYFNDWIYSPGFTHLSIQNYTLQQSGINTNVELYIRQRLSHAPGYYTHVPVTVSYFDADRNRVDEVVDVSGECTLHTRTFTDFVPVYIALDLDGQVQDAITDEWIPIADTGTYDFGTAKMMVQINHINDTALLRVEHNWIAPDAMRNPIQGLHLHDYRYWTVSGVFDSTMHATATIDYDGTSATYLDNTFFTNSEDSLTLMYRANQDSDWAIADSFFVDKQGSAANKTGSVVIYNLKQGEYSLAIYNSALPTAVNTWQGCSQLLNIETPAENAISLYPNPANDAITVQFANNTFNEVEVFDITGRSLVREKIASLQSSVLLNVKPLAAGSYVLSLKGFSGNRSSIVFIKN